MTCRRITRRQLLLAAGGAAGAAALGGLSSLADAAAAAGAVVAVASGADAAGNVRKAVAALGGMSAFVSRGDIVVLKPNIGWDRRPEQAANTSPEAVVAAAEMCLLAGAKAVRVFDRTCNDPRRCYVNSGIQEAVEQFARKNNAADALRIYHVEDRKFQTTAIPGGQTLTEWELYRDVLDADKVINLPVAKHHSLAVATLGLKNMMGVMGGNRGRIHANLADCLVDLHRRVPSRLTIIDAARVLVRNGPSGGNVADVKAVGKVFASSDVVAADAVAAERIFGLSPREVPHIRKALEGRLGVSSPDRIRVVEA